MGYIRGACALGLLLAVGCADIAGLDHDYVLTGGAGGTGAGGGTSSSSAGGATTGAGGGGGAGGGVVAPLCGDGEITAPELCDDGNSMDGDGCSADCMCGSEDPDANAFYDPATGHCYVLFHTSIKFLDAVKGCQAAGMYPAIVTTEEELALLASFVPDTAWLGGTDALMEGSWIWADMSPWTIYPCDVSSADCMNDVNLWDAGEPNNAGTGEDCLALDSNAGRFNDRACVDAHHYLCERSPKPK